PTSLRDALLEQWALIDCDETTRRLGVAIIDHVRDSGRLETSLEQLVATLAENAAEPTTAGGRTALETPAPPTMRQLEDALARVQQLDPPGIAARSLQECLLLQLEAMPQDTELERTIIENHFDDLQRNRLPQIARAVGVELDDVKGALQT